MRKNTIELLVGCIVLIIAALFLNFAYNKSEKHMSSDIYTLSANFQDIEGIFVGTNVKISGIKVGYVDSLILDPETYQVNVKFHIDKKFFIPEDSSAIVSTSGILGEKYIRVTPGGSEDNLFDGGKIKFTQSALNIEDLIAKIMYALTSK